MVWCETMKDSEMRDDIIQFVLLRIQPTCCVPKSRLEEKGRWSQETNLEIITVSNSDAKWGAADLRWNLRELCNWEDSLTSKWRILGKDLCLYERQQGKSTMSDLGSWLTQESILCWEDQEYCFDYVHGSSRRERITEKTRSAVYLPRLFVKQGFEINMLKALNYVLED